MGGWVRWQGSRLERREGRVALERLGDRHASRGADLVPAEAAHTAKEGKERARAASVACRGAVLARTPTRGTWFEARPSCAHLSVVQLGDLVALHRRKERAHVHGAEHLPAEVHCLAARRLALDFDQRGAVCLDHLVLQARDQRLVVGVGERTAARHDALVEHHDLRVAVEGAVQQDG
eukprot:scaffold3211_cov61-Phaeocystis_antarctica.AAC.1